MKKIILLLVVCVFSQASMAAENLHSLMRTKIIQAVCSYDDSVLRSQNKYSACFVTHQECLESPIWKIRENVTAYSADGAFGNSCHFVVDKNTLKVIRFRLTEPGE